MTIPLRERAQLYYDFLEGVSRRFTEVQSSPELTHYPQLRETLDSLMERMRSKRSVERKVSHGLLDELDNPGVLDEYEPKPWSDLPKKNADDLALYAKQNELVFVACLNKIGTRTSGLDLVHGVLLSFSYNSLEIYHTLNHLDQVNRARDRPFGFNLATYATSERLKQNFMLASQAIINR